MKLSDIEEAAERQKTDANGRDNGLVRSSLSQLPDIQSHALVVSGIRRCGKSTLLHQFIRQLGRDWFYLNFDDLRLYDFSPGDFRLLDKVIAGNGAKLLFFDEIQSAAGWELYVRQKLDEGFQVMITGSNASLLSRELGTMLTGRHLPHELFPFSYEEYLRFTGTIAGAESLDAYLDTGGFPEYLKTGNADILAQLQLDILYRDIAVRYGVRDHASLRRLFGFLIRNAAGLVSPSKLTGTAGVKSPTTVLEYISYFEAAYLVHLVPVFSWSAKAQSLSPKKLYVVDTGIIKTGALSFSRNSGALLENFVYNTLRLAAADIYYFSGADGAECDFVVNPYNSPCCVQVCHELTLENQDREIRGLVGALDFFNQNEGVILTHNTEDLIVTNGKRIAVTPAWKLENNGLQLMQFA
ncbi:MAG: ATP-binding protein [Treponema sp.]|jgi:predicted AAA+ superfamily ATPase|nr:ATP-binding protein [Treponema sp.]